MYISTNMSTLNLPSKFGDSTHLSRLVDYQNLLRESRTIKWNWKETKIIQAAGCAILGSLSEIAIESGCKIKNLGIKKHLKNKKYAIHFAAQANQKSFELSTWQTLEKDFVFFGTSGKVTTVFHDYLDQYFQLSDEENYNVRLIISELISNSVDHSGADRYFVYIASYKHEILLGVLDMGVSIPKKLSQKYDFESDLESLKQAIKLGVSTRRERVGGRGLNVVFEILKNTKGVLTMMSGRAAIRRYFNNTAVKSYSFNHPLRGCWVFCRLRRDT